jgi:hypothetical protein
MRFSKMKQLSKSAGSPSVVFITVGILLVATFVQLQAVQRRSLPVSFEQVLRSVAVVLGISLVPILILLSYRAWAYKSSDRTPLWRRRFGLASIVIPLISWTLLFVGWVLGTMRWWPGGGFLDLVWMATLAYTNWFVLLLAVALRGMARINIIICAVLIWFWIHLLVQI